MNELIISVYGSHNSAISMLYNNQYYVVEVERWVGVKNSGLTTYLPLSEFQIVFDEITDWLLSKTKGEDVDVYLTGYAEKIKPKFNFKKQITYDHHTAHAATAFYQSPYDEMLVFTFDGGGDGAFFNVYRASRETGIKLIDSYKQDLGFPYMLLSEILNDIKREDLSIGNLVYAGKLMGLCAYGNVRTEWIPHFDSFYSKFYYDGVSYLGGTQLMEEAMITLMESIGITDYEYGSSRYEGQLAWDIAATSQQAFENMFFKLADKHLAAHPDAPIGLAGGCALNVLLNTKLANMRGGKIYVPPNTNDCGISVGGLLWYVAPKEQIDLTYSGLPIMDEHLFSSYINKYNFSVQDNVTIRDLAGYISEEKIVGVINGNSEHGSRALGNRSIICSPTEGMKDTLNVKVKHREWYRPFAPVVRFEDVGKYFEFKYESRHMTYAPMIRDSMKAAIPAVTHEDGTGRLQTVTNQQNEFLYDLITEYADITDIGVLLNTSFNNNGKPILSTLADAFELLHQSSLDAVYYKNRLVFKPGNRNNSVRRSTPLNKRINTPVLCLIHTGINTQKILEHLKILFDEHKQIMFVGSQEVCDAVANELPEVLTYVISSDKFYHSDRMIKRVSEDGIPSRLKLIWAREVCTSAFKTMNAVAIVDYSPTSSVKKLLDAVKIIEQEFYENETPLHHNDTIYSNGFGVLMGKVSDIQELVHLVEGRLLDSLAKGETPDTDKQSLRKIIKNKEVKNV